jgi:predicted TPR repeat methyltransferase
MIKVLKDLDFSSLLEVGCGNGMNLYTLKNFRPQLKLTGCDVSQTALSQLKNISPDIETYELDITKTNLPRKYDIVMSFDVLEHIEDDMTAIINMAKMADKYLFIATLQGRMRNFEKRIGHVRNYRHGELTEKINEAGLKVVRIIEWGWPLFSPLYRDYLDNLGGQEQTIGSYNFVKKIICNILYTLFLLNSSERGDMIFVLAQKQR